MVEFSDDENPTQDRDPQEKELDNLIMFYRKKKEDEEKIQKRRQLERERLLKKKQRGGYGNSAMASLMGDTQQQESFRRMQEIKAIPVGKFPEIYKNAMKAEVSEEFTAVNPVKEAKERKRQLKMMVTQIGV